MATAQNIIDREKPFFDYIRYVMQAVAVGTAFAIALKFKIDAPGVRNITQAMEWFALAMAGIVLSAMMMRLYVLTTNLLEYLDPNKKGFIHFTLWTASFALIPTSIMYFIGLVVRAVSK